MKINLDLEESLFREAKLEAVRTGRTLSEVLSAWVRSGLSAVRASRRRKSSKSELISVYARKDSRLQSRLQFGSRSPY